MNDSCSLCPKASRGSPICPSCAQELRQTRWGVSALVVSDHRIPVLWRAPYDGPLTDAIFSAKFRGQWSRARVLGDLLGDLPKPWMGEDPILVPVPLTPARLAHRGFNQSVMIAQSLARAWNLKIARQGLTKTRRTERQAKLGREGRSHNLQASLLASRSLQGKRVMLIDDIMTTGATLREAAAAIQVAGGLVVAAAVVARVDRNPIAAKSHARKNPRISHRPRRTRDSAEHR